MFRDAYLAIMCNSITSFLSGFVIFTVLGYMSHVSGRQIQHVATEGPGLVFIVYPAAIAAMPGSVFWALIFFMMLLNLGLDSSVRYFRSNYVASVLPVRNYSFRSARIFRPNNAGC